MNRAERDSFTATTDQTSLAYGESACLETPPELFAALHTEFNFDVDLTANEHNHLLPRWFGPGSRFSYVPAPAETGKWGDPIPWVADPTILIAEDALTTPWVGGALQRGFSNPPYGSFVSRILTKAVEEQHKGFLSVFLLPMRVNRAFKSIVLRHADEIRFVDERIKFWYQGQPKPNPKTGNADGALFDSIVVVFRPRKRDQLQFGPKVSVWHWDPARLEKIRRG